MAIRQTRCSRLARSLASGIFLCAAMRESIAGTPDVGGANATNASLKALVNGDATDQMLAPGTQPR